MNKKSYGNDAFIYTISDGILSVDICNVGARINALRVNGVDIVYGFDSVDDYAASGTFAGATIGRVANRIAKGKFELGGKTYTLACNNGENHLHGGNVGFDKKTFTVERHDESSLVMSYVSPDGEEGYPGELKLTVEFAVADGALTMKYDAVSDKDTVWCPTNHAYFNLDGENSGKMTDNILMINAPYFTPVDGGLIPTGELKSVVGTPFDFTSPKRIGDDIACAELAGTKGYDHNFVFGAERVCRVEGKKTGIVMELTTDMPCVQFYSSGYVGNIKCKSGHYGQWTGFCLEPQYMPNAVNMPNVDSPVIRAGEHKTHYIEYKFGIKN